MFKSWRSDKNKIKAVFRLQFQATQVPKLKKSAARISLVPDDVGKSTFKLDKVAVEDGTCLWEKPVYVTVRLIRDSKTGNMKEKIYHFIVSTGSSKSGYLGEASIDFADFAAETEPMTVSLPLKFANSGAILHVTIQKMEGVTDPREVEENEDISPSQARSLQNQLSNNSLDGKIPEEDEYLNTTSSLRQNSMPQRIAVDAITNKNNGHRRTNTDWSVGSNSDGSLVDSTNSPEDTVPREWKEATSDGYLEKLKNEVAVLNQQADISELELQSLRKQISKENKRGQDQTREIASLREERDALEMECEKLKRQKYYDNAKAENQLQSENEHLKVRQEETRKEIDHQKEVSNNLRLQLEKIQDSNSELMLAVKELNELLEEKDEEISILSSKIETSKLTQEEVEEIKHNSEKEAEALKQRISDQYGEIEFYRNHKEELELHIKQLTEDYEVIKEENENLSSKLEENHQQESMKIEKEHSESLTTIKELKSQIERLEDKIKQQSEDYSESLIAINELQSQVKGLKKELEKQAQEFEDELDAMARAKTEQEQRAIRAEDALRNMRWKNAVTVERIQEEFKRVSAEMESKLNENEKLVMEARAEADALRGQKSFLEEMLQKAKDELDLIKDQNRVEVKELTDQIDQISLELEQKSKQLEYAETREEEKQEAFSMENQMLRIEIEKLIREKSELAEQKIKQRDDREQIKSVGETDVLLQRWNKERDDLEKKFASAKKEAEKAHKELISTKSSKDKKEMIIVNLQSEVENMKVQQNELKKSLVAEEREKDNLRKQVSQLRDELQKKERRINSIEKELKNCGAQAPNLHIHKEKTKLRDNSRTDAAAVNGSKHTTRKSSSGKGQETNSSNISGDTKLTELLSEVTLLKERNKCMETELKDMQERYSEISLKFAEVEGERQQLVMTVRNLKSGKKS